MISPPFEDLCQPENAIRRVVVNIHEKYNLWRVVEIILPGIKEKVAELLVVTYRFPEFTHDVQVLDLSWVEILKNNSDHHREVSEVRPKGPRQVEF